MWSGRIDDRILHIAMNKAVRNYIEARYEVHVSRVVHRLRRVPAEDLAGEEVPLRTLWDHWKWEMQEEHSLFHDALESLVLEHVQAVVDSLSFQEGALLTLTTPAVNDLDEDAEPVFAVDAVAEEITSWVNARAEVEPHRRQVQDSIDGSILDRHNRDRE